MSPDPQSRRTNDPAGRTARTVTLTSPPAAPTDPAALTAVAPVRPAAADRPMRVVAEPLHREPADGLTGPERDIVVACLGSDESAPYNVPVHLVFDAEVDVDRLAGAVQQVLDASPVLARTYLRDGSWLRRGPQSSPTVEVLTVDADDAEALDALVAQRRIGVLDPCLVRATLVLTDAPVPAVRLFLNAHHALVDGVSLALLLRAVVETYLTGVAPTFDTRGPGTARARTQPVVELPTGVLEANVPVPRVEQFLAAVHGHRRAATGTSVVTAVLDVPWTPTFSSSLGAVVPALGLWCGTDSVVLGVGLAGRTSADRRAIGNFVRLEPLVFDLGHWLEFSPVDLSRRLASLGAALALRATAARPASGPRALLAQLGVVVDYKRESLVPTSVHPGLATHVEPDPTYVDPKYAVHLSIDQVGPRQEVTVTAPGIPESALRRLVQAYTDQLLYGPFRAADQHRAHTLPATSVPA